MPPGVMVECFASPWRQVTKNTNERDLTQQTITWSQLKHPEHEDPGDEIRRRCDCVCFGCCPAWWVGSSFSSPLNPNSWIQLWRAGVQFSDETVPRRSCQRYGLKPKKHSKFKLACFWRAPKTAYFVASSYNVPDSMEKFGNRGKFALVAHSSQNAYVEILEQVQ